MSKYQKEIETLLNKSESNVNKELQALYKELANEVTKEIVTLADQIEKDDKFSKKLQKERLETIRSQMYAKANQLEGNQKQSLFEFLKHDAGTSYNELFYEFEMTERIPVTFAMITDRQIATIINTPVAGRKLSARLKGNSTKMKQNLNRVLTRGFAKGWSTQKMATQIAEIGGANYRRAMTIARTESGRVTSVTRQQSQQHAKELGIKAKKKWISTLDGDTRNTHRQLDGQVQEVDDYFKIGGMKALQPHMFGIASEDCNCRCRTINVLDGYEAKLRRNNDTGEVEEYKNYHEWLKDKTGGESDEKDWVKAANVIKNDKVLVAASDELLSKKAEKDEAFERWRTARRETSELRDKSVDAMDRYQYTEDPNDLKEYEALIAKHNSLVGKVNDLQKKYKEKYTEYNELGEGYVKKNADRVKELLSEYRTFGVNDVDLKSHITNPRAGMSKVIAEAYDYYPTDWVKRSADFGPIVSKKTKRGYYAHSKLSDASTIALSGQTGVRNSLRTAIHELAHRQEHIVPDIIEAEKAFYERRTKGEELVRLRDISSPTYDKSEVTRVDSFINPYMGKYYSRGDAYELLTMGMDTLYADPMALAKDEDMFTWVVEMILTK